MIKFHYRNRSGKATQKLQHCQRNINSLLYNLYYSKSDTPLYSIFYLLPNFILFLYCLSRINSLNLSISRRATPKAKDTLYYSLKHLTPLASSRLLSLKCLYSLSTYYYSREYFSLSQIIIQNGDCLLLQQNTNNKKDYQIHLYQNPSNYSCCLSYLYLTTSTSRSDLIIINFN